MPPTTIIVDAVLFDMDGTLVDSTAGVHGAWELFAQRYPDIDVHEILSSSHGVRTVENLKKWCKIDDPAELEQEASRFELAIIQTAKANNQKGIVPLPGTHDVLTNLEPGRKLPKPRWAICTSATRGYASAALGIAEIVIPDVFVVAEDVTKGKPEPDPYLLGAMRCGVNPERCLVVEDAPSGIRSGNSAGCKTLAVVTTHTREQVEKASPDFIVPNLSSVTMKIVEDGVEVTMDIP